MQVQHKMYILFRLLDEFLVLVIRSPRSLLAIEHSPGHVGPLNKPDQRLHHLRHWRSELRLRLDTKCDNISETGEIWQGKGP